MRQQPDKIFREKLSQYGRSAPAAAWDRIEKNLGTKTEVFPWRKIAASVLLLAIATPALIYLVSKDTDHHVADVRVEENKIEATTESIEQRSASAERNAPAQHNDREQPLSTPPTRNKIEERVAAPSPRRETKASNNASAATLDIDLPVETSEKNEMITATDLEISQEIIVSENAQPTMTLVISAEETTSYYEGGEIIEEDDATSKGKKTSTFKKLLRRASDLKTNQDPFGELRQKKNEILALNFKNEKKRSQKNN